MNRYRKKIEAVQWDGTATCAAVGCRAMAARGHRYCGTCLYVKYGTSDGRTTGKAPKLTPDQVAQARRMSAAFKTQREIAAHFGVAIQTIQAVLKRRGAYAD